MDIFVAITAPMRTYYGHRASQIKTPDVGLEHMLYLAAGGYQILFRDILRASFDEVHSLIHNGTYACTVDGQRNARIGKAFAR